METELQTQVQPQKEKRLWDDFDEKVTEALLTEHLKRLFFWR